ncbi:MAG: rhodanese-like domain-containing protein [Draconibacterium sp.]
MIQQRPILKAILILLVFAVLACSGGKKSGAEASTKVETKPAKVEINAGAKLLLSTLNEMGDYVNSRNFPSLIKASAVYDELDGNNLIVDVRGPNTFASGHIKGAVNVDFTDIPDYFSNQIKPSEYDKIIVVCYSGQISSYTTSLLRLEGYNNVYSMRWGMSGWNRDFARDAWLSNISSDYQDKVETNDNPEAPAGDFPKLNEDGNNGKQLLQNRLKTLFAEGYSDALITADEVFENQANLYIINYERKDKYESGHIPGAVRYKPGGTLGIVSEMQTIPDNKEVVVYCNTGQNSGFVTAYLRLFGYNAKSMTFGNNAFMHDKMAQEKSTLSWVTFSDEEIEDFPYVKN